jgi:hypothetical protein
LITRFQFEGKGYDPDRLEEELSLVASRTIALLLHRDFTWECVKEEISPIKKFRHRSRKRYKGKIVLVRSKKD